jgi:hypothetical protein
MSRAANVAMLELMPGLRPLHVEPYALGSYSVHADLERIRNAARS